MLGAGITDLAEAIFPTGTVTTDSDGVYRYTLSDSDIRKIRSALLGALPDPSKPSRPLFRLGRIDEAVVPAVLERYGLYVFGAAAALVGVGVILGRASK